MTEAELLELIEVAAREGWAELDISGKKLTVLPPAIGKLTQLKKLILGKYEYDEEGDIVGRIGNNLSALPPEIRLLNQLEELEIVNNRLTSLPPEICQLTNLQSLSLEHNLLSALPPEICQLTNLQSLILEHNLLSALPPAIGQLTNLQSLSLSSNQLSALPPAIGQLTLLQSLNLSSNLLSALPPAIGQLTNLQSLFLEHNLLSALPPEICQLTNLQFLYLSGNQLSELPPEICQLTNLQSLIIGANQLSALPPEIGQLSHLQSLIIIANQLSALPPKIGQLSHLQSLDISRNQLSALPPKIGQLSHLQSLDISRNQLSALPPEIGQLTLLQSLNLRSNQLSTLPPEIGQLTLLQSLNLRNNQLSALPPEFCQLSNLQSLSLEYNQLSSLPPEIGQLTLLQSLNLHNNQLSALPPEFCQLSNLQSLSLKYNQLSALPPEICQLSNLQSLILYNNQLSSLPSQIKQLKKLKKLDLRRNPLPIPPEILGAKSLSEAPGNVNEILDFYFRVQDPSETESLYEAKLTIVGEGGAGKTSLANKILNSDYKLLPEEKSTKGIDVLLWKFPHNNHEFRVNIWDFGGQEIYHQTHQFFLTERSLYIVVADTRKENTDFYWWLKVVELLSDNSPVFIVKNEKQERQCEVNERALRGEFTNLKEVLPTNLSTNRGLAEIKDTIEQYITRLPHVGTPLPKLWVGVRCALENDSRNYISLEQYRQICQLNNLTNREDMLRLSRYLHDLGICLHFQDDSTLKHYIILKPEWGTTAVYKVLDNQTVKKNLGCFTDSELKDIWFDSKYAEMRDELLQLMMRFKLCYPIPNRLKHYIAPQLLECNQPDYNWDESNNLILRYKYEFMPKGIITRFIVETHPWIEEQKLVWRNGVVLSHELARAEVIEHYNQREITVRVSGNRKKELLAVVNHELEKIHQSFERLKYETLVPCNCKKCVEDENPYTYTLNVLYDFLNDGDYQIQCQKSRKMVDVRRLIDDVNLSQNTDARNYNTQNTLLQRELEQQRKGSFNRKNLHNALMSAFLDKSSLEQMLYFGLGKNLNEITRDSNLQDIVFKLMQTAEAQGWLQELIGAARNANSGNSQLNEIAQELLNSQTLPLDEIIKN
jgi:internalin A